MAARARPAKLRGAKASAVSGRVLTSASTNAHNTFDKPDAIAPADFAAAKTTDSGFTATLPPKSVVVLQVK